MRVFDQYINAEPITIRGTYGDVVAVIPAGTRGCINRVPTKQYPDPCFEVMHEEQWYSTRVKKDLLVAQRGNTKVQKLMALCPAIQYCLDHTKHNIRIEVSSEHRALSHFFLQVHSLRFLPPTEMEQALRAIRQDKAFQNRIEEQHGKKEDHWHRTAYEMSQGHYEYLLRMLDQFLATGILKKQLCSFLVAHQEPVMRDKNVPCPETAAQMTRRVALKKAEMIVAQEKVQVHPYPFLYAAFIVSEYVHYELFQAWYSYRDIPYSEQECIAKESLITAGYLDTVLDSRGERIFI